jgi:hypothetical protein
MSSAVHNQQPPAVGMPCRCAAVEYGILPDSRLDKVKCSRTLLHSFTNDSCQRFQQTPPHDLLHIGLLQEGQ